MYSRRLRQLVGALGGQTCEELDQVAAGELPFEWVSHHLVAGLEGEDSVAEVLERADIGRSENLALEDREVDLDLIQPAGVNRQMDEHEVGVRILNTLGRHVGAMRATVVDHPEDTAGRALGFLGHDLGHQTVEGLDTGRGLQPPEELGAMDVPGSQISAGAATRVLVLDQHRMPWVGGDRGTAAEAGLNGSLLIGRDHELISLEPPAFELARVEVEHTRRSGFEVGVARKDPAAVGPGLVEPAPDGGAGDLRNQPSADHFGLDVGDLEPREWQAEPGGPLPGDGLYGDHQL